MISKLTMSETEKQTITKHTLVIILKGKDHQIMTFRGLIQYKVKNILVQKLFRRLSEAERLVPRLFLFTQKAIYEVKVSGQQFSSNRFL